VVVPGRPTRLRSLCGPTINLAEQEGRYVRPSAAVGVVVAIDKLLGRKQYIHVVATGLMCIPPSAQRVEICDHLTPSQPGAVSPRLSASQKLHLPAQNVHAVGDVPGGLRPSCDSVVTTACVRC
jgi:hypothetical protein